MKKALRLLFLFIFLLLSTNVFSDIGKIKYPIYSNPAIVKRGESFEIKIKEEKIENLKFILSSKYNYIVELNLLSKEYDKENSLWKFKIKVPQNAPLELYDLKLIYNKKEEISKRAVKIIDEFKKDFSLIHITDIHIGFPGNCISQGCLDSSTLFKKIAEEVNLINPEFVLITGDLTISSLDVSRILLQFKGYLMESTVEKLKKIAQDEYDEFLNILELFEVPTFIVPGNHEMVGEIDKIAKKIYEEKIGNRYFSFDYGNCHLTGLDNSNMMEATIFCYGKDVNYSDLDDEQLKWFEDDLKNNINKKLKIIFFHVPIHKVTCKFKELAKKYQVDLALCGHTHKDDVLSKTEPVWIQTKSSLDYGGYRLVRVKDEKILSYTYAGDKKVSNLVGKLKIIFSPENNGKNKKVKATIENTQDEDFEDAIIKFLLPKAKSYKVSSGKIFQVIEAKDYNVIYVKTFINKNSKIEIQVE